MVAPTKVNILVKPLFRDGTDVVCAINPATGSEKYVQGGIIILDAEKRGEKFKLNFELLHDPDFTMNWHSKKFAAKKNSCPPVGYLDDQFTSPTVSPAAPSKLVVSVQPNKARHTVHYALYFDDGNGHMCTCDPIILPDNGGTE
jgi:hypothetical protein